MKPVIVLSGVNLVDMGPLAVYRDALASLAETHAGNCQIIALVHKAELFDVPGVTFHEFPRIKSSWVRRLKFEYLDCHAISKRLAPDLWLAMHDITPRVAARVRAVYCHNPAAFYPFNLREAQLDPTFGLFNLFYRFLYRIGIQTNDFVIVQQEWMRSELRGRYRLRNVVVAHPSVPISDLAFAAPLPRASKAAFSFFYPAFPRTFKNFEQILRAGRKLDKTGARSAELWLTIDGSENRYAAQLRHEFSSLTNVRWLGLLPRAKVIDLYHEADCLLFPSRLETWGMPITEFKVTGKPILAIDLPYAHETIGTYPAAAFFPSGDDTAVATLMQRAADGKEVFSPVEQPTPQEPFSRNWSELWDLLLQTIVPQK